MDSSVILKLVKASGVEPGELVLVQLWGEDGDAAVLHAFASAVAALGASPVELLQSRTVNAERFALADEEAFDEGYFRFLSGFDAVLDLFQYAPVVLGVKLEEAQTARYRRYMASLFRSLSGAKRFTQLCLPSAENAEEAGLPPAEFTRRLSAAYDVDYQRLAEDGRGLIAALGGRDALTLVTGGGCKLCFDLRGRAWHLDAGSGDLPCGEIYIAPLERHTNGTVFFERLYADDWGVYDAVTLTVECGIVISADNDALRERFAVLEPADKTICELGFGLNPNVTELCGYAALDEKAHGTFHIAIGANTMFGGANESNLHMDFVGTATIV